MELDERLERLLSHLGMTRTAFADKIGVKVYKLNDISRGQTKRIPSDVLTGINREFPHISKDWLLTGEGDMLIGDTNVSGNHSLGVNNGSVTHSFNSQLESGFLKALETSQTQLTTALAQLSTSQTQLTTSQAQATALIEQLNVAHAQISELIQMLKDKQ